MDDIMKKVTWRIVPFAGLLYLLSFIDRVNVGNVHQSLKTDLGLSEEQFGQTVGIFFLGYCLFEVPSNMAMKRFSPSTWIARIMVTWGLLTVAIMFCKNFAGLMVVRALLGCAESGLFPGLVFYFTFWFNKKERAMKIAMFFVFSAVAGVFGGLLAYGILKMDGVLNLKGWQWLFLIEGGISVLVGISVWFFLPDYPQNAKWLTPEEKVYVISRVNNEKPREEEAIYVDKSAQKIVWKDVLQTVTDLKFIMFALIYFLLCNCAYTLSFFLPAIISEFGFDTIVSNLITTPVYTAAIIFSLIIALNSDRTGLYPHHIAFCSCIGTASYILLAISMTKTSLAFQYTSVIFSTTSTFAMVSPILAWLTLGLKTSTSSATGTAFVVSVGNIGGYVGPQIMTFSNSKYGSYSHGIAIIGALNFLVFIGVIILGCWTRNDNNEDDELSEKTPILQKKNAV
eukprot:TRINITY_DN2368_c0_g1_i1.p1 TRINITY_DN2368_c0_g1~~TRINITY_DN2368_c0_g1_i1.p1  ORF type:complete len:454 (+),score=50.40 TRINITY_DN2368_c0_g1_i1:195-1556(+)